MKLHYYGMAAAASLMMLSACTHENWEAESAGSEAPVFIPGDSEFEISLSSGNGTTVSVNKRSAVNAINQMTEGLGVFCLARGKQNINQAAPDITWFSDDALSTCTLMKNVKASVADEDGNLSWDGHYFYPISQFYAYGLYGYYPYVEDENVTYANNQATVHYTIDGTQDLIWGRASAHDADASAYSATFFRQSASDLEYVPVLQMKHLLTRLEFYVQPGETYTGSGVVFDGAENMVVDSIQVLNAACNVNVLVADLANPNMENAVVTEGAGRADFRLRNADGKLFDAVPVGTSLGQETKVGESIMLAPASTYILRIYLKDTSTNMSYPTEYPLTLTSTDTGAMFQTGMSYKVTILANKPKEITLKANVGEWPQAENNPPSIIL